MASGKQTTRGVRRIAGEITRGSRGPGGEVAWVALLLVVAVLVALASVV